MVKKVNTCNNFIHIHIHIQFTILYSATNRAILQQSNDDKQIHKHPVTYQVNKQSHSQTLSCIPEQSTNVHINKKHSLTLSCIPEQYTSKTLLVQQHFNTATARWLATVHPGEILPTFRRFLISGCLTVDKWASVCGPVCLWACLSRPLWLSGAVVSW